MLNEFIQSQNPKLARLMCFCQDPVRSGTTRRRLLAGWECAREDSIALHTVSVFSKVKIQYQQRELHRRKPAGHLTESPQGPAGPAVDGLYLSDGPHSVSAPQATPAPEAFILFRCLLNSLENAFYISCKASLVTMNFFSCFFVCVCFVFGWKTLLSSSEELLCQ